MEEPAHCQSIHFHADVSSSASFEGADSRVQKQSSCSFKLFSQKFLDPSLRHEAEVSLVMAFIFYFHGPSMQTSPGCRTMYNGHENALKKVKPLIHENEVVEADRGTTMINVFVDMQDNKDAV